MALTREFSETVRNRLVGDVNFRLALLKEALDILLEGDVATGKALLRDYVNATVGFEVLAELVSTPAKSLHRMLGVKGNPRADNLFKLLAALQKAECVDARVEFQRGRERSPGALSVHEPAAIYAVTAGGAPPESAGRWARQRAARHRKGKP